ncbi:MAG: J domain-containing protein [Bacteroidetes bacterium]|nr:J domain-containing protein [Bacteroidota bacterium]
MEQKTDLGKLIKRLNLIKQLILLEEFDDIASHVEKLVDVNEDAVKVIYTEIKATRYSDAVRKIEVYINQYQKLSLYEDPEIEALKIEIKRLEISVSTASDEVAEIEKLIHDFGVMHSQELGEIINRLLKYRKEKAYKEKDQSEEKKKEFEEAEKDYEQYSKEYEEAKNQKQFELTEEQKNELKIKYRKASKLCHPDVVTDELKEHAEVIFRELNEAYQKNDLKKVTEILEMLEKGEMFISKSEGINEKIKLKAELIKLRKKFENITVELNTLKQSETYQTIIKIDNWEEYFKQTKLALAQELKTFE